MPNHLYAILNCHNKGIIRVIFSRVTEKLNLWYGIYYFIQSSCAYLESNDSSESSADNEELIIENIEVLYVSYQYMTM